MSEKPYREGVSFTHIIEDGWSRDFKVAQTVREAGEMGYTTCEVRVLELWAELDTKMAAWYGEQGTEEA